MARSNKYTSINFNDIYHKKSTKPVSSSSPSSSSLPHKTHGGMLVLTRPQPKPLPIIPKPKPKPEPIPDPISLRPLGKTGSSSLPHSEPPAPAKAASAKSEPFVPPHLRPGFVGREEKFGQNGQLRTQSFRQNNPVGLFGAEDGRPKSGGYERIRRSGESDLGVMSRPGSGGGWYGSNPSPRFLTKRD